jgi:carbonic anhydrase
VQRDVDWYVLATSIEVAAADIAKFRALLHANGRPIQPGN